MPVRNAEGVEIYLQIARGQRDPAQDEQLLVRLERLALQCAPGEHPDRIADIDIENCLHAISESSALFPAALTRWLPNETSAGLGRALVHQASVMHLDTSVPQPYDLTALPELDVITVARRLCSLAAPPAVSLGWALSLARDFADSNLARSQVDELITYHVDQLLLSTTSLLASPDSVFQHLEVSIAALKKAQEEQQALESLTELRELKMSAGMRLLYSSLKRSEQREMHRRSEQASVFRGMIHQVKLKYASQPVIEIRNGSDTNDMAVPMFAHSLAIELPLSELTDPVTGHLLRHRLWQGPQS